MLVGFGQPCLDDPDAGLQREALRQAGCRRIVIEDPAKRQRSLKAALREARDGTLVVTELGRLARSLPDLIDAMRLLKQSRTALRVIEQDIDTAATGSDMFRFVEALASFEAARRTGGRKRGPAGTAMGRPKEVNDEAIKADLAAGMTPKAVALKHGVDGSTVYRLRKSHADAHASPHACGAN